MDYTATTSTSKYNDVILDDIADFVYNASSEEDAINNAKRILKRHEKNLSFWELLKLMLNK